MSDERWDPTGGALDGDGDPGVELLVGLYPSVAALAAERDRLRVAWEGIQTLLDERIDRWALAVAERDKAEAEVRRLRAKVDELETECGRFRAVMAAAGILVAELDRNPIGEYGDAVCEAIDLLDAALKATKEGT